MSSTGYVYAIGIVGTQYVKIGHAQDPKRRLASMQGHLPFKLELLEARAVDDPRAVERALHELLADGHVRGEWFELPERPWPELFAEVAAARGPARESVAPEMKALAERTRSLRLAAKMSQKDLAAAIGASPQTISNLEQGKLGGIRTDHLLGLGDHFEVRLDYLAGRSDQPDPEVTP